MARQWLPEINQAASASLCLPRLPSVAVFSTPLFNSPVAGFQYYEGFRCIQTIYPGDYLALIREPDNPHDEKAIAIHAPNDGKFGYLPRYLNEISAVNMDNGIRLHAVARFVDLAAQSWEKLEITVVLS